MFLMVVQRPAHEHPVVYIITMNEQMTCQYPIDYGHHTQGMHSVFLWGGVTEVQKLSWLLSKPERCAPVIHDTSGLVRSKLETCFMCQTWVNPMGNHLGPLSEASD